nr:hypothetical protein [Micromonospora sp. DSM 115978]
MSQEENSAGAGKASGRRWRSISDRRIGGHLHHDLPVSGVPTAGWVDTGSAAGLEIPDGSRFRIPALPTGTLSGGFGPPMGFRGCLDSDDV